jgi:hypothetical protein
LAFQFTLNADETFSCGMDGKSGKIADDPLATDTLGNRRRRPRSAEEISDKIAFIR